MASHIVQLYMHFYMEKLYSLMQSFMFILTNKTTILRILKILD